MHFGWLHIMLGEGDYPLFPDAVQDPGKTLPHHADLPTMTVSDVRAEGLEPYRRLLKAAAAGTQPDMSGVGDMDRDNAMRIWKQLGEPSVTSPPKHRLTKSDSGKTVLSGHGIVGGVTGGAAYVNLREREGRVYQLRPGAQGHCISELHRLR
jgi:hypothetical protein